MSGLWSSALSLFVAIYLISWWSNGDGSPFGLISFVMVAIFG